MNIIDKKIQSLGIKLPSAPKPAANYIPYVISNNLIFIAGQVPFENGEIKHTGKVGENINIDKAKTIARTCGLNIISVLKDALDGDLSRVTKCVKLGIFVACTNDFHNQPEVANGASDLMVEIFGEAGKHARFAVGTNSLPRNVPVEVDAVFEFK
ncbi:MAG: RidA family protein [Alphaproteobacteria bacterium]|nr:RidA family protein [Alphaproteobacteria bacterium]